MPAAIALRHVPFEDLDAFAAPLTARGYSLAYREAPVDDLAAPDLLTAELLIVLGGPIGAYEEDSYPFLTAEIKMIERRLAAGRPVLGICLGAQLIARALGARVYPGSGKELGWAPIALSEAGQRSALAKIGDRTAVLHWHVETTARGLERWYVGHALDIASTPGVSVSALRQQSARHAPLLAASARAMLEAWLEAARPRWSMTGSSW